jgi:EpsD family peptidyl-prolyl cis-trans isomerase
MTDRLRFLRKSSRLTTTALALSLVFGLSACGERKEEKKVATQVAVKVNGSEISVHQLNAVLARAQGITAENADQIKKEILDKLIDQQLAYDQGVESKLDRTPDVMMAIESAKREIVARAYLEQLAAAQAKPTDEEVAGYYNSNPALFSRRKIYAVQELTVESQPGAIAQMKQMVAAGSTLDDMTTWLKNNQVRYAKNSVTRPAEQIPLEILPRLVEFKDGQIGVFEGPQNFIVARVVSTQSEPMDEATARPRIQQFLQNQNRQKLVADQIKKLKDSAKLEYMGDFAAAATAAPAAPPAANVEKGVAGLK